MHAAGGSRTQPPAREVEGLTKHAREQMVGADRAHVGQLHELPPLGLLLLRRDEHDLSSGRHQVVIRASSKRRQGVIKASSVRHQGVTKASR